VDKLTGPTTLGYVYGGIIANAPHVFYNPEGLSSASGEVFAVVFTPVPEPSSILLAVLLIAALWVASWRLRPLV
jgi:hypothetical protein